ncbi:MAG: rhodanese-like domain-containing protein [Halobacteriaceae archaeon]
MDGEITAEELAALLDEARDTRSVRVVDIRPESDYETGHIPNSICIPFPSLPNQVAQLTTAERIVTVCPHGEASQKAARMIAAYDGLEDDVRVESLAGGLAEWSGELVADEAAMTPAGDESADTGAPF